MDENSIMVNSKNSSDVYYSYGNKIYRWSLTSAPPITAKLTLPDGEIIRSMATNFMGDFGDDTQETLLYVATYNPTGPENSKEAFISSSSPTTPSSKSTRVSATTRCR